MAVIVCVVAIGAAAVLFDDRHSRMVFEKVALEGKLLLAQLSEARIAHDIQRSQRGLRVALAQRFESLLRFDEGRAAFITLGDEVLWQSDERLGKPPVSEPPVEGHWEGIEPIFYAGRTYEAYLIRATATREWPVPSGTAGLPGEERAPETYVVTYRVALVTDPYRRAIMVFRAGMAAVVAVAMVVLGAAMYVLMHWQLRPLDRSRDASASWKRGAGNASRDSMETRRRFARSRIGSTSSFRSLTTPEAGRRHTTAGSAQSFRRRRRNCRRRAKSIRKGSCTR